MYEVIEKNEYGVLVKNTIGVGACIHCRYDNGECGNAHDYCKASPLYYYLNAKEAAKLETEITPETFTINDMYVESKLLFDCQDKLNDLQIENKKLKERIEILEGLLRSEELKVAEFENKIPNEIKRFECGTDEMVIFKYLIENSIQVKRYDGQIFKVVNVIESEAYPIIMNDGNRHSKNGFFKTFTNIDGSEFFYD